MTYSQSVSGLQRIGDVFVRACRKKNVHTTTTTPKRKNRLVIIISLGSARKPGGLPVADQQSAFVARMR